MREILFKAKRIDNGEWVEGFLYVCGRTGEVEISWYNEEINMERYTAIVDPETVCEYTGLVDSKGNKIFEHDILMNERTERSEELFYGEFNCSCCNSVYGYYTNDCVDLRRLECDNSYIVVCGNKFD